MKFYNAAAPNPRQVRIFIAEKGIDIPRVDLNLQDGESRTPEYLAKNSLGEAPILELDDGTVITESIAICRYIESLHPTPALFGKDGKEAAKIEMWNRRMEMQIFAPLGNIAQHTFPFFADKVTQIPAFAESQKQLAPKKWEWLNNELADGRPFVAGDSFSIADISGMTALMLSGFVGVEIPADLEHTHRWADTVRGRPSWEV